VFDYDNDGNLDILFTNGADINTLQKSSPRYRNRLFRNNGDGTFTDVTEKAGLGRLDKEYGPLWSVGAAWVDVNNDGLPDLAVVALAGETFPLYQNNGHGGFPQITSESGMTWLSNPMAGYSPNIADFDNDGWKDLFVSRGDVASPAMADRNHIDQPNTVFRNTGNGKWSALTEEAGFAAQPPRRHRGSAIGDFNHDGRLDVVVRALSAPAEIWMNDSPGGDHWLELKLEGTKSNRDGIGARIRISARGTLSSITRPPPRATPPPAPARFTSVSVRPRRWTRSSSAGPREPRKVLKNMHADRILRVKEPM
jgi:hypothetical protein